MTAATIAQPYTPARRAPGDPLAVRVPGAALRDRLDTTRTLVAVAEERGFGWPESVTLYTYPGDPSSPIECNREPYGILSLTCATEADAWAWCEYFGDPGEARGGGVYQAHVIHWRGWHVHVSWYGGAS